VQKGHYKVVEILLDVADPDIRDNNGNSAFSNALQIENMSMASLFINKTRDLDVTYGPTKATALQICAAHGYTELVRELLDRGADPNLTAESNSHDGSGGYFALYNAVYNRHHSTVAELAERADINQHTELLGYTALHLAAELKDDVLTQILIQYDADVDARDAFDRTPLHIASIVGAENVARLLLMNGADESARDHMGICASLTSPTSPGQVWLSNNDVSTICTYKELKVPVEHDIHYGFLTRNGEKNAVRIRKVSLLVVISKMK
jgi:ankyrin repeat protein